MNLGLSRKELENSSVSDTTEAEGSFLFIIKGRTRTYELIVEANIMENKTNTIRTPILLVRISSRTKKLAKR